MDNTKREDVEFITGTSKVSSRGQVVVPRKIREGLNIKEGDEVQFTVKENGFIYMTVLRKESLLDLFGILEEQVTHDPRDFKEIRRDAYRDRAEKKYL